MPPERMGMRIAHTTENPGPKQNPQLRTPPLAEWIVKTTAFALPAALAALLSGAVPVSTGPSDTSIAPNTVLLPVAKKPASDTALPLVSPPEAVPDDLH